MGIFRRRHDRGADDSPVVPTPALPDAPTELMLSVQYGAGDGVVQMTGTTTHGAVALAELFASRGLPDGGMLQLDGWLAAEPENPVDPNAVAVEVEGRRIGYLPGYLSQHAPAGRPALSPCQVQLWAALDGGKLRVLGWASTQQGELEWPHSEANPPAITTAEQRSARAAGTTKMVDDALGGSDPVRQAQFQRGMVGGYHYLETVEPIQQLKREGRLEEALALCYGAIDGAEADRDGREPAPWYTEQAAIIHRKLGQRDEEIAVLQRWLGVCPPERRPGSTVQARLDKLVANNR